MKWKSSTVFVAAAFALSVVLLFAKAGMMRERATADRPLITNHLYSPAAADPELRDRRAAERIAAPRPSAGAQRAVIVREPTREPAPRRTPTPRARATTASRSVASEAPARSAAVITHPYHVITGTYSQPANAERALAGLKAKGYREAFVGVFDEGTKHCTIAGKFEREDHARVMLSELKTKWSMGGYIYEKTE